MFSPKGCKVHGLFDTLGEVMASNSTTIAEIISLAGSFMFLLVPCYRGVVLGGMQAIYEFGGEVSVAAGPMPLTQYRHPISQSLRLFSFLL